MDQIEILLEEYRQLFGVIVPYRLSALDQRIPVAGATLTALVGTIGLLTPAGQAVLFIGLPLSMVWLLATTIRHAQSLNDALQRIAAIERAVNAQIGTALLVFQSTHPSSGRSRTGIVTIYAVLGAAAVLLGGCLYLASTLEALSRPFMLPYAVVVAGVAGTLVFMCWKARVYRFLPDNVAVTPAIPDNRRPGHRSR